jgi:hypothetical protein
MKIRTSLLGGAALGALAAVSLATAADAAPKHHKRHAPPPPPADAELKQDVADLKAEVAELKAHEAAADQARAQDQATIQAMQGQLADANQRAARAEAQVQTQIQTIPGVVATEVAKNKPKPGWWDNTSITGRMYYDLTNIDEKSSIGNPGLNLSGNGGHNPSGFHFDVKRFYVGIDHSFNSVYSANITTDVTYDSTVGATQIFIKKAYLQGKYNPAFIVRIGAADLPWVPFDEDVYGYRYVENTLIDRSKFGTSADWGVHVLGSLPLNGGAVIGYQVSAVNGAGFRKPGFTGGVNRSEGLDFEGRVNVNYKGFVAAIGGYDGKLGSDFSGAVTFHNAERFDALLAYGDKWGKIGGEYMWASNDTTGQIINKPSDTAEGWEIFGNVNLAPQWQIFGRYDRVKPSQDLHARLENTYYNVGIQYEPVKIVDFALVYKHDSIEHGAFSDQNFATLVPNGVAAVTVNGTYDEVGLFGQFRW